MLSRMEDLWRRKLNWLCSRGEWTATFKSASFPYRFLVLHIFDDLSSFFLFYTEMDIMFSL